MKDEKRMGRREARYLAAVVAATVVLRCGAPRDERDEPEVAAEFVAENTEVQGPASRPWEEPPWPAWDGSAASDGAIDEAPGGIDARAVDVSNERANAPVADTWEDHFERDVVGTDSGRSDTRVAGEAAVVVCEPRLLINEVLTGVDGEGGTSEEFVEVRNAGGCAVALYGWTLRYLSATGASGRLLWSGSTEVLAPGAYFVTGSPVVLARLAPDALSAPFRGSVTSGQLSAAGGALGLFDPGHGADGAPAMDSLGYAAAPTNAYVRGRTAIAPPPGRSLSRVSDRGDNSVDFAVTATPTPGSINR